MSEDSNERRKRIAFRGSFTIEASFLMPLLVFLIWNVMYAAFFVYDQSTALQGNYCTALRTERMAGTLKEKTRAAEEKYDLSVRKKIAAADLRSSIEVTEREISVETGFTVRGPGGQFLHSLWEGRQKQSIKLWEPVKFIRNCRKVKDQEQKI